MAMPKPRSTPSSDAFIGGDKPDFGTAEADEAVIASAVDGLNERHKELVEQLETINRERRELADKLKRSGKPTKPAKARIKKKSRTLPTVVRIDENDLKRGLALAVKRGEDRADLIRRGFRELLDRLDPQ